MKRTIGKNKPQETMPANERINRLMIAILAAEESQRTGKPVESCVRDLFRSPPPGKDQERVSGSRKRRK